MARRRRRSIINGRMVLIVLAVIAVTALAVFLPRGGSSSLKSGSMEASFIQDVAVIRDESYIPVDKFDQVDYLVNEGAPVNAETPVATVYKWGYTDEMTQSLVSIQHRIYEKQIQILDGIETAELASLNSQIDGLRQRIQQVVSEKSDEDLLELEREIKALLQQRMEYLRGSVQPDVDLTALYAEETTKLNQIAEYASTVSAKMTGLVSFYFDGYEQVLNVEKLDMLNSGLINKIISGSHSSDASASADMLYRLVNPTRWYIAFVTPSDQGLQLVEGQIYNVVFDGLYDKTYRGTALAPAPYDGGVLNMLEFSDEIGGLMSARVIGATITAPMTGFEVDIDAIKVKNGACTLATSSGDREVKVVAAEEDKALITGNGLADGLKYKR